MTISRPRISEEKCTSVIQYLPCGSVEIPGQKQRTFFHFKISEGASSRCRCGAYFYMHKYDHSNNFAKTKEQSYEESGLFFTYTTLSFNLCAGNYCCNV